MDFADSEWATDVHYCRRIVNPTTCSPFYNTENNPFTVANAATFNVLNKGHFKCQTNNIRNIDIWSFLPSKWVFGQFRGTKSVMTVSVVARISDCQTAVQRRLLTRSDNNFNRDLVQNDSDAIKIINATGTIDFGALPNDILVPINESDDSDNSDPTIFILILVITILALASCCCFGLFLLQSRRRRSDPTEFVQVKAESSLANSKNF